ncbi:hypothetical protein V3589_00685 [Sinorhizobium fredii]|uniref:hypothetical protein n=2 Tax=Rhizobium fredii TaxID=380 RepID=UPI0004B148D5|nr:hypothetical protein [Sinorhizobium fredii]AWI61097.1 hypothetical protein AB395_00005920 [Sinorhizobium fredii CCBAU 45436]
MMLIIRKPVTEEEIEERRELQLEARPRRARDQSPNRADEREDLDDPNSLFWRGVWMIVF